MLSVVTTAKAWKWISCAKGVGLVAIISFLLILIRALDICSCASIGTTWTEFISDIIFILHMYNYRQAQFMPIGYLHYLIFECKNGDQTGDQTRSLVQTRWNQSLSLLWRQVLFESSPHWYSARWNISLLAHFCTCALVVIISYIRC